MSTQPENFEKLQKLLKLKSHEQPPPGYFNNFSTQVVNRIERASEHSDFGEAAWLKKFLTMLETNPIAAGLFGMSVCGLLISGIAYSQYRTPSDFSGSGSVSLDVADSGMGTKAAEWSKTASIDSLAPSTGAVLGTTNAAGDLFDGINSGMPIQKVNLQLNQ